MQNTKCTHSRNQPQQDNQSTGGQQCYEGSADVEGKSLEVNENDVRKQDNRPTGKRPSQEGSADVEGKSLEVNENDVRKQNRSGTETVKGEQQPHARNKT
jgi:hypothetical protein